MDSPTSFSRSSVNAKHHTNLTALCFVSLKDREGERGSKTGERRELCCILNSSFITFVRYWRLAVSNDNI